jgi:hypothetical protein
MKTHFKHLLITTIFFLYFSKANAQDLYQTFIENNATMQQAYLSSYVSGLVIQNMVVNGGKGSSSNARDFHLTYNPSIKVKGEALNAFIARGHLEKIADELRRMDFDKAFTSITAPYHLQYNDAADILTAYQVLSWLIANQAPEPKPDAVAATRYAVASALAKSSVISDDPYSRAKMGESVKILFLVLQSGWHTANKKGTVKAYSDQITNQYKQQYHQDLRKIKLDKSGWHQ